MTPPATAAIAPAPRSRSTARRVAVRHPRRVSGPARVAHSAAAVALPAPGIALPGRRPLRAPAPGRVRPSRDSARTSSAPGLLQRAASALSAVADSALLDRLVRGRVWIGLLAFALCGIVAMQLVVLNLNTGIGRALARETVLERQDAQIGVEDSVSSAGERVEPAASAAGMTLAAPAALHFVGVDPSDVQKAVAALSTAVSPPTTQEATSASGAGAVTGVGVNAGTGESTGAVTSPQG